MRYRAFISYSHADAGQATWLHRRLEAYRLPSRLRGGTGAHGTLPERLTPIFRDRDDLSSAGQLGPQIEAALAESEALVVVCSPNAAQSTYVNAEVLAFKRLGRGDRIYAYIADGEPNAGDARECFPPALRYRLDAAGQLGTTPANPIAADARPGKDGKSLALLKLLAGLFGLPLDALRQREVQRRHQRMAAITALAVLVMLVTSFLAIQAVAARKAAERRQKQAETLVSFMLGDLSDKLSEVSRLDILSTVNGKAMDYFKSLTKTDVTDESLEQRAKALVKIGNVRIEQGQFKSAMDSYRAAEDLTAALSKAKPGDLARQLAYADVLSFIGLTSWHQDDLDGARRSFDAAHDVLASAWRFSPNDPQLLYQMSTTDNNAGHVLEATGDYEMATVRYRRMLDVARRLAALSRANVDWQQNLGLAHNNLAKMSLLRGDLATAIAGYRADVDIQAKLVTHDPQNDAQRERLLRSRAILGRTLMLTGAIEEGGVLQKLALDEAERLHAMEPASSAFQYNVGLYALQRARIERQLGQVGEADKLIRRSLAVLQSMIATTPDQPRWQRDHAEALTEQAMQLMARGGSASAAKRMLQQALAVLEPQLAENLQERSSVLATADAQLQLAALLDPMPRRELAERTLATIEAQRSATKDPRLLALRLDALRLLGRGKEAAIIASELAATGYRAPRNTTLPPLQPGATATPSGPGSPAPSQDAGIQGTVR